MSVATMGVHATVVLGLASAAWLATRRFGRCELRHVLWCAALVGLLVPPLFEVPVLPSVEPAVARRGPAIESGGESLEITSERREIAPRPSEGSSVGLVDAASAVWLLGFLVLALGTVAAAWSFRRRLREADLPEADVMSTVRRTAAELGLRSLPRVRVLDAPISPAIWPLPSTLVLPRQLLGELSPAELRAVLLHELTHYTRRDHWIRLLEAVVLAVWWWLPLAWWFRTELRFAEEASCDQRVLRHLRGGESPALYAEALIKTVALMARGTGAKMPGLATGAGGPRSMTWRIQRIMSDRHTAPLSAWTRAACLVGSVALLTLAPIPAHIESSAMIDRLQDPVQALRTASEKSPRDPQVWRLVGSLELRQDRPEQAAAAQRALARRIEADGDVEVPERDHEREGAGATCRTVLLAVTREGKVVYAGRVVGIDAVQALVRKLRRRGEPDEELEIVVRADRELPAGKLVRVVDACEAGGATGVSLATILEEPDRWRTPTDGTFIRIPDPVKRVVPRITAELRALGEGRVSLSLHVDSQGRVRDVRVQASSDPAFERPAIEAARLWEFEAQDDARAFRGEMWVPITMGFPALREARAGARVIHRVSPVLTAEARRHTPGRVHLCLAVDEEGRVGRVQVENSTDEELERPAIEAIRQWRFAPATRDGQPVATELRIPITFSAANPGDGR